MTLNRFNVTGMNKKGFSDKKIEFYTQKKKIVGARFSASSRINGDDTSIFNKTATNVSAMTPGSFFNMRA
jgi:hypothetical protein